VVTTTNINLSGAAPSQVDGVTLSHNDRVLVTGQTAASQNGIYYVTTLGSGSNGTWSRSTDSNQTGELLAGTIVMVTEGSVYADTQWKLITDNPIVIDTTPLTFTQNYSANSISGGTSNVVVNSNANVTISSAGAANILTVSNTGVYVSGVVSATGNITGNYFVGNGSALTGIATGVPSKIANGTSNVNIPTANSNIAFSVANTANTLIVSPGELTIYGVFSNPKTIASNVVITDNINSLLIGPISVAGGVNIYVPDSSTLNIV
jgi:hypothetical protein